MGQVQGLALGLFLLFFIFVTISKLVKNERLKP